MDTLLKNALEGLDSEEVIIPKRKTLDNGNGRDAKKIKPNAPVKDAKEEEPEGGKDNDGRGGTGADEPKDDKSWNWTPRASNGYQQGGGYQRPQYQQYQQRPPYGGGGGFQRRY